MKSQAGTFTNTMHAPGVVEVDNDPGSRGSVDGRQVAPQPVPLGAARQVVGVHGEGDGVHWAVFDRMEEVAVGFACVCGNLWHHAGSAAIILT